MVELGLFVVLMSLPFALPVAASTAEPHKRILILSSEDPNLPGPLVLNQAIRSTLNNGSSVHVQFYNEAQDNFRIPNDKYEKEMVSLLRRKYEGEKIDLIFALVAPALKFLLKHRSELFPDTPIVFVAHDEREVAGVDFGPNVTGVVGKAELTPTMDLALALRPGTKRVVVVAGNSYQDQFWMVQAQKDFRPYQDRVELTYLTNITIQDLRKEVASLPKESIVLFLSFMLDSEGKSYSAPEALSLLASSSSAPIFGGVETGLGHGSVGGRLLSYESLGSRAAELGLRILAGEKAQDISIQMIPSVWMFDWRELRRWGITERGLPAGSIIRFKEPSFWELYKWRVVGAISLCILEALLIIGLLINRTRRRQAEEENEHLARVAEVERRHLDEVVSNVPGVVWEISIDPATGERKTTFVSRHVEQMLGYSAEDFLGRQDFGLSLIPEEGRDSVERETREIFAGGTASTTQFRWLTKDGRMLWVEAHLVAVRDEHNRPIGVRGVTMDITDRKLAEESLRQSEERNHAILRALPDLMFLQSREGTYLDYHAPDPRQLLVPPAAFLGKNMREVLPPELAESLIGCFDVAEQTKEPQILEYSLPIQGEERWYEARIVLSDGDKILSIVRDVTDRHRAEADLSGSEARFAKAFKANPQPMSLTTFAGGCYLDVNESFLTMSGYTREEVIGRTSLELDIWDTPGARSEFIRLLKERGAIYNLETKFRTKTGSLRLLLSSAEQFDLAGEHCVLVASSDITERQRAVEELRQSEERFRNMADTAPVLIWIAGPDKLCTYFNQGWLEFTGRKMEQELGNGWAEGVYSEDYAQCLEIYNSAFDRREQFKMEYRLRRADGVFRWIYDCGTPRFSSDGEFLGYIGSCIDIADRKEAEDAVRYAKDELQLVADALPVLISQVDKNCCYRFNNLAYEKWFGQPSDQIIGRNMREVLGEAVWERIRPQVEKALTGHEVHYEDFLPYRHGGSRWVSVTGIPTRDAEGQVNGFVSLVADITESRRAEEALRDLSGRLINAQEEERSRVARELHDDLSQRIAVLSIGLEQIAQQIPEGPDNLHARIHNLCTETQEISTELHRVSYQLHPSKLDHLGLVAAVRSFCEELAGRHDLSIKFRHQGFTASLSKDITLCLFRIVQESLHNVVKHSGAREAQIVLEKTDRAVGLSVSDTGCGFDTESSKMTSGLGFLSMRERLRLVGGQLSIRSRPFEGTQIEITVPLVKHQERASVASSGQSANQSRT